MFDVPGLTTDSSRDPLKGSWDRKEHLMGGMEVRTYVGVGRIEMSLEETLDDVGRRKPYDQSTVGLSPETEPSRVGRPLPATNTTPRRGHQLGVLGTPNVHVRGPTLRVGVSE